VRRTIALRLPNRIVHPPPTVNTTTAHLNVPALRLKLRSDRKCGPREVPAGSGHWVHLDCNPHAAMTKSKPFSGRKLKLLVAGALKLDSAVGRPGTTAVSASVLPDAVDHRQDGTEGPVKDQGQVGACTAFSLSSAMDNAIRRQNKPDTISSLHLWSHYGFPQMQQAGDNNINKPIAPWEAWPYDERVACELDVGGGDDCGPYTPDVKPGSAPNDAALQAKIRDEDTKGRWRVTEYDEIPSTPDSISALLATGADVWLSMNIGSTWLTLKGDTIQDWTEAQLEGGHAIILAGYRHKGGQRQFLVHNSWGKDWGDGGFAYITEAMVTQFIKHAYGIVLSDGTQAPPASDPNGLTDDDCGQDELVDSVTGQCATMCPDDSRPSNGQCAAIGIRRYWLTNLASSASEPLAVR
jgi:hypothetical protein